MDTDSFHLYSVQQIELRVGCDYVALNVPILRIRHALQQILGFYSLGIEYLISYTVYFQQCIIT